MSALSQQNQNLNLEKDRTLQREMNLKKQKRKVEKFYNAVLEQFGSFSNGLTSLLDDGVGIVLDLHRLTHGRSQPRHVLSSIFSGLLRKAIFFWRKLGHSQCFYSVAIACNLQTHDYKLFIFFLEVTISV